MKPYAILRSPSPAYSAVVVATGTRVPHEDLDALARELRRGCFGGVVIFDMLTANGTRKRRFYVLTFDGKSFAPTTLFKHVEPEACVRDASNAYLQSHARELDLSLLSSAMRFAVQSGVSV